MWVPCFAFKKLAWTCGRVAQVMAARCKLRPCHKRSSHILLSILMWWQHRNRTLSSRCLDGKGLGLQTTASAQTLIVTQISLGQTQSDQVYHFICPGTQSRLTSHQISSTVRSVTGRSKTIKLESELISEQTVFVAHIYFIHVATFTTKHWQSPCWTSRTTRSTVNRGLKSLC